jgi:hypothetical protein
MALSKGGYCITKIKISIYLINIMLQFEKQLVRVENIQQVVDLL